VPGSVTSSSPLRFQVEILLTSLCSVVSVNVNFVKLVNTVEMEMFRVDIAVKLLCSFNLSLDGVLTTP
jgi:hypothetical protein